MRKKAQEPYRLSTKSKRGRFFSGEPLPHGIGAKNRVPALFGGALKNSHQMPKGGAALYKGTSGPPSTFFKAISTEMVCSLKGARRPIFHSSSWWALVFKGAEARRTRPKRSPPFNRSARFRKHGGEAQR